MERLYRQAYEAHGPWEETDSLPYAVAKRIVDVVVSGVLLLVLFPVFAIIALAILIQDGSPVFYKQMRIGRHGTAFSFVKFRSMVINADAKHAELLKQNESTGPTFKMKYDPRVTSIGRFLRKSSLDELPQLLAVFQGNMSLIGPRPHLPREVMHYEGNTWQRLRVQPGLMCLREVTGRSRLTFEEWIESDLHYVANRSMITDFSILFRGFIAILRRDGAY